jgi:hypothetical protein
MPSMRDRIGGVLASPFSVSSAPPTASYKVLGRSGLSRVSGPLSLPDVGGSCEFQIDVLPIHPSPVSLNLNGPRISQRETASHLYPRLHLASYTTSFRFDRFCHLI